MDYEFLNNSIEKENLILPNSDKINLFLLKNNNSEIIKGIDFIASAEKFLHVHGFMGTGKRQYVNYICEFINNDVIKLEYYCKESTVCDDILLTFTDIIDNNSISKAINLNAKITTLNTRFIQQISSIKKPFLIILHSLDDMQEKNIDTLKKLLKPLLEEKNVKLIISTRAMQPTMLSDFADCTKIFLKAFTQENFKQFLDSNQVIASDRAYEDFYKLTRGYYYYAALTAKIISAMKIDLNEFLQKFKQSGMSFDSFLGATYINLVPTTIRNFFWFLRTIRHGITLNALANLEIYDDFSIEYLKTNLMIFQDQETLYVQDFFLQKIDISIPKKTQIKLHKYIIGIYEKLLKLSLKERLMMISRQALREEIEYHNECINNLEKIDVQQEEQEIQDKKTNIQQNTPNQTENSIVSQIEKATKLYNDKKYTDAIEEYQRILENEKIDLTTLVEIRFNLAKLYKQIGENKLSLHYYELVETYYIQNKEFINLNYLYYEMTDLYYKMYKNERAIETIKKVIYSVDTPQSLLVSACTLLGNIYSDIENPEEAYSYYKKALESLDDNVEDEVLAELYFKFALANDDRGEEKQAFEYYNKCIALGANNNYRALSYSNLASCYNDNENFEEALNCFKKAYEIEKASNNFDGIYYNSFKIAQIYSALDFPKALDYFIEAKKSAEFINEDFYILESSIALGDYYYDKKETLSKALIEYIKAKKIANNIQNNIDLSKIENRINDMKLRIDPDEFAQIEKKYGN